MIETYVIYGYKSDERGKRSVFYSHQDKVDEMMLDVAYALIKRGANLIKVKTVMLNEGDLSKQNANSPTDRHLSRRSGLRTLRG